VLLAITSCLDIRDERASGVMAKLWWGFLLSMAQSVDRCKSEIELGRLEGEECQR
jgi:hypothetical protein